MAGPDQHTRQAPRSHDVLLYEFNEVGALRAVRGVCAHACSRATRDRVWPLQAALRGESLTASQFHNFERHAAFGANFVARLPAITGLGGNAATSKHEFAAK